MPVSNIVKNIKHEINALAGKEAKDKQFCAEHIYEREDDAITAFILSKEKLFDVNAWSEIPGINSTFILYDDNGKKAEGKVLEGYFIKILLPGAKIKNWVHIKSVTNEADFAQFIVHPSEKPADRNKPDAEVKHFFAEEASSTFRVMREGNKITAFEIGRNEVINNNGHEAGSRALLNTLIAEGGWAGFQKIQWEKLTRYLVHLEED